jgi:glycosyltransferase involved in cell wall biosynthesis
MQRIRVVRIIDRLNIGGPTKHVTWLTAGLNPERFETTLITGVVPASEGDMEYFARAAGVEPLIIEEMSRELSPGDLVVILKILRALFRLKPHIVHTHKAKAGAVGRAAATLYKWLTPSALWLRPRNVRIAHTYHGHIFHSYYGPGKTRLFIWIERMLARFCTDRIIAISEQQRDEICHKFKVGGAAQFRVVPLGIDFHESEMKQGSRSDAGGETLRPTAPGRFRKEIGVGDDEILIGIVGRLCEVKNHAMLLASAAKLQGENLSARIAVVGDGHLRAELESAAKELGVDGRVIFTGFREDAVLIYADFDIAALTSLNEGTPLTLIEAMSRGCAVASTEVGGVIDLMGSRRETYDGFTLWDHGITAPSRDIGAFTAGLRFLIERPELRREMGSRARAFVLARLSKERLIGDIDCLYRDLIAEL